MVFHEIESISEVESGHRIVIYYIKGESKYIDKSDAKLFKNAETALVLLGKKNDDVLLIEVLLNSDQFRQFVNIYRPEVTAPITLFAVNNEGIPLISENIYDEVNIFTAIEKLSTACNLKEIPKSGQHFAEYKTKETILEHYKLFSEDVEECSPSIEEELNVEDSSLTFSSDDKQTVSSQSHFTRLHIRLPSGAREEVQFDDDATLQEVWVVISTKFNIKDFDLKTYNHPVFSEDDYDQTLQQLDLCPRGVLIVVNKNVIPFNNNGGISAIIQDRLLRLITLPSFAFLYVRDLFFVFWNYLFPSFNNTTSRREGHKEIKSPNGTSNNSNSQGKVATRKYVSRSIGNNIHTLHRNDDSDEENNRYNGNSTQQK